MGSRRAAPSLPGGDGDELTRARKRLRAASPGAGLARPMTSQRAELVEARGRLRPVSPASITWDSETPLVAPRTAALIWHPQENFIGPAGRVDPALPPGPRLSPPSRETSPSSPQTRGASPSRLDYKAEPRGGSPITILDDWPRVRRIQNPRLIERPKTRGASPTKTISDRPKTSGFNNFDEVPIHRPLSPSRLDNRQKTRGVNLNEILNDNRPKTRGASRNNNYSEIPAYRALSPPRVDNRPSRGLSPNRLTEGSRPKTRGSSPIMILDNIPPSPSRLPDAMPKSRGAIILMDKPVTRGISPSRAVTARGVSPSRTGETFLTLARGPSPTSPSGHISPSFTGDYGPLARPVTRQASPSRGAVTVYMKPVSRGASPLRDYGAAATRGVDLSTSVRPPLVRPVSRLPTPPRIFNKPRSPDDSPVRVTTRGRSTVRGVSPARATSRGRTAVREVSPVRGTSRGRASIREVSPVRAPSRAGAKVRDVSPVLVTSRGHSSVREISPVRAQSRSRSMVREVSPVRAQSRGRSMVRDVSPVRATSRGRSMVRDVSPVRAQSRGRSMVRDVSPLRAQSRGRPRTRGASPARAASRGRSSGVRSKSRGASPARGVSPAHLKKRPVTPARGISPGPVRSHPTARGAKCTMSPVAVTAPIPPRTPASLPIIMPAPELPPPHSMIRVAPPTVRTRSSTRGSTAFAVWREAANIMPRSPKKVTKKVKLVDPEQQAKEAAKSAEILEAEKAAAAQALAEKEALDAAAAERVAAEEAAAAAAAAEAAAAEEDKPLEAAPPPEHAPGTWEGDGSVPGALKPNKSNDEDEAADEGKDAVPETPSGSRKGSMRTAVTAFGSVTGRISSLRRRFFHDASSPVAEQNEDTPQEEAKGDSEANSQSGSATGSQVVQTGGPLASQSSVKTKSSSGIFGSQASINSDGSSKKRLFGAGSIASGLSAAAGRIRKMATGVGKSMGKSAAGSVFGSQISLGGYSVGSDSEKTGKSVDPIGSKDSDLVPPPPPPPRTVSDVEAVSIIEGILTSQTTAKVEETTSEMQDMLSTQSKMSETAAKLQDSMMAHGLTPEVAPKLQDMMTFQNMTSEASTKLKDLLSTQGITAETAGKLKHMMALLKKTADATKKLQDVMVAQNEAQIQSGGKELPSDITTTLYDMFEYHSSTTSSATRLTDMIAIQRKTVEDSTKLKELIESKGITPDNTSKLKELMASQGMSYDELVKGTSTGPGKLKRMNSQAMMSGLSRMELKRTESMAKIDLKSPEAAIVASETLKAEAEKLEMMASQAIESEVTAKLDMMASQALSEGSTKDKNSHEGTLEAASRLQEMMASQVTTSEAGAKLKDMMTSQGMAPDAAAKLQSMIASQIISPEAAAKLRDMISTQGMTGSQAAAALLGEIMASHGVGASAAHGSKDEEEPEPHTGGRFSMRQLQSANKARMQVNKLLSRRQSMASSASAAAMQLLAAGASQALSAHIPASAQQAANEAVAAAMRTVDDKVMSASGASTSSAASKGKMVTGPSKSVLVKLQEGGNGNNNNDAYQPMSKMEDDDDDIGSIGDMEEGVADDDEVPSCCGLRSGLAQRAAARRWPGCCARCIRVPPTPVPKGPSKPSRWATSRAAGSEGPSCGRRLLNKLTCCKRKAAGSEAEQPPAALLPPRPKLSFCARLRRALGCSALAACCGALSCARCCSALSCKRCCAKMSCGSCSPCCARLSCTRCCPCCSKCCRRSAVADATPNPLEDRRKSHPGLKSKRASRSVPGSEEVRKLDPSLLDQNSVIQAAIPVLPLPLAWFCLVCNVIVPGLGTIASGAFCLCVGRPRFTIEDRPEGRLSTFCLDLIVGVGQLFTVIFCLVGWGWSIWWGTIMVRLARKHKRLMARGAEELAKPAARRPSKDLEGQKK